MHHSPAEAASSNRKWWALLGVGMGLFMSTLDAGIINISLPTLVAELNTDFSTVQWVVLSYLLVIASSMMGVARLGDIFGKKKLYVAGMALFALGSLLCGLAPGVDQLLAFRALQGAGAVMMTALGMAIITEVFPPSERGRALGISGSIVSVGIALGPTVGGVMIGRLGWHSVFLVNVPIGVVALSIVWRVVPPSARGGPGQGFDVAGALVLLVTLVCYTLGMTLSQRAGFGDVHVIGLLAAAVIGLGLFLFTETRTEQPMIDLGLFRNALFGINLLMGFVMFIVLAGLFIMPFFLELVKGYPTEQVGLLIAAVPVSMGLVAPVGGALSDRFGSRGISVLGLLVAAGACLLISTLHTAITPLGYVLRVAPLGVGMGLFQSPNNSAIMGAAPRERLGVASGLLALSRTLGQTSGLPLIGAIFAAQVTAFGGLAPGAEVTDASPEALVYGVTTTLRIAAGIILFATALAVVAWWLDRRQARREAAPAEMSVCL
jgi:EmrB/QacA subfamily drug resistance transporter